MITDRLEQLRALLAEEPGDTFLRYAIALELRRAGRTEEAIHELVALLQDHPEHVPAHHQLALMLVDSGRIPDAVETCTAGALQALAQGEMKARRELLELKAALLDET